MDSDIKDNAAERVLALYNLDAADKKLLQLMLSYPSMTNEELGSVVGLERSSVSRRTNDPKFLKALNEFYKEPLSIIEDNLRKAARVLVKALDSEDERIRVGVAIKILISSGVLKNKVNIEGDDGPLVIESPLDNKVYTIGGKNNGS